MKCLDKIFELKIKIGKINIDCEVIILMPTYRFDNQKAGNTVSELTKMLIDLNIPIVKNKNISQKHLGYKGFLLNSYGSARLAMNLVSVSKNCEIMLAIQQIPLNINIWKPE